MYDKYVVDWLKAGSVHGMIALPAREPSWQGIIAERQGLIDFSHFKHLDNSVMVVAVFNLTSKGEHALLQAATEPAPANELHAAITECFEANKALWLSVQEVCEWLLNNKPDITDYSSYIIETELGEMLANDLLRGMEVNGYEYHYAYKPAPASAATGERYQVTGGSLSEVVATTIYTCACGMYSIECHETQHEGLHGYHVNAHDTEFIVTEGVESFEAMRYKSAKEAITYCDNHCHLRENTPPQPDSSTPDADNVYSIRPATRGIAGSYDVVNEADEQVMFRNLPKTEAQAQADEMNGKQDTPQAGCGVDSSEYRVDIYWHESDKYTVLNPSGNAIMERLEHDMATQVSVALNLETASLRSQLAAATSELESMKAENNGNKAWIETLEGYLEEIEAEGFIEDVGLSRWKKIRIVNPD